MSIAMSPYDGIESTLNESYKDDNEEKNYEDHYLILLLNSTRRRLLITLMVFFFVFSLVVNSLSFIVLMRRAFFLNAYAFGQRFLCVLDIGFALVVTLGYLIQGVFDNDFSDWDTKLCMTIRTTTFIVASISNWTIVYLSIIRYISLKYPMQLQSRRFREASYASLWLMSFVISLFYVAVFLNKERIISVQYTSEKALGFCKIYISKSIHISLVKSMVMMPETILPGICIILINTKIYSSFSDLSRHAEVLKHALRFHSAKVAKLQQSLRKQNYMAQKYLHSSEEYRSSLSKSAPLQSSASYAQFFSKNLRRLSSIKRETSSIKQETLKTPVVTFCTEYVESNEIVDIALKSAIRRNRIIRKLSLEKKKLRKATITYGLLCDGFIPNNRRRKLFPESKPQGVDKPNGGNRRRCCCYRLHSWLNVPSPFAKQLIVISTLMFVLLNVPYCIWFIFSNLFTQSRVGVATNSFTNAIAAILKCGFHASNCVVYILSSNKVQSEVSDLIKKIQCYN